MMDKQAKGGGRRPETEMIDPAVIEAAARALVGYVWPGEDKPHLDLAARVNLDLAARVVAAVTPLIEAVALEKAARTAEGFTCGFCDKKSSNYLAASIRTLKEQL